MTPELPTRFGKYVLLDRLATGGMAEVFLAKVVGVESFERSLAIKCMRPELAENDKFTSMFIDEAKLAGRLSHANIIQIYELGRCRDQLYIAMELVDGFDLRRLIDRARELGVAIHETFAAYVISRAAFALDYAHSRVDSVGTPLNLVHRDISPPNLLISREGEVKVVDFGIAKASERISETTVGVLKGKIAYMSPEQARGELIDGCTDIYTLGVVLYELLTGHRLYAGDTDFEILERVKSGAIPDLRERLPEASPEMIGVLHKALATKRKKRFGQAALMGKALEPLLIADRSIFGATDAAAFLKQLFSEDFGSGRRPSGQLKDLALDLEADWQEKTESFMSAFGSVKEEEGSAPRIPAAPSQPAHKDSGAQAAGQSGRPAVTLGDRPKAKERAESSPPPTPPPSPPLSNAQTRRPITRRTRAAKPISSSPEMAPPESDSRSRRAWRPWLLVALLCGLAGGVIYTLYGPTGPVDPPAVPLENRAFETTRSHGYLAVKVKGSKNASVYIDGRKAGKAPLKPTRVPTGIRTVKVQTAPGGKSKIKKIRVTKKNSKRAPLTVTIKL